MRVEPASFQLQIHPTHWDSLLSRGCTAGQGYTAAVLFLLCVMMLVHGTPANSEKIDCGLIDNFLSIMAADSLSSVCCMPLSQAHMLHKARIGPKLLSASAFGLLLFSL